MFLTSPSIRRTTAANIKKAFLKIPFQAPPFLKQSLQTQDAHLSDERLQRSVGLNYIARSPSRLQLGNEAYEIVHANHRNATLFLPSLNILSMQTDKRTTILFFTVEG